MNHDHDIWVCVDCYFAHHYGATATEIDGRQRWFIGDADEPTEREPLHLVGDLDLADNTCSNHSYAEYIGPALDRKPVPCAHCGQSTLEDGYVEFSWSRCDGCGSTLGGARYRLAVFTKEDT